MSQENNNNHMSHRMVIMDMAAEKPKAEVKEYEIWIGPYNLGMGDEKSTATFLGKEKGTSFKVACCIYEHRSSLKSLMERVERGDTYIEDIHFGGWDYDPKENRNSWMGKYYPSEAEAMGR